MFVMIVSFGVVAVIVVCATMHIIKQASGVEPPKSSTQALMCARLSKRLCQPLRLGMSALMAHDAKSNPEDAELESGDFAKEAAEDKMKELQDITLQELNDIGIQLSFKDLATLAHMGFKNRMGSISLKPIIDMGLSCPAIPIGSLPTLTNNIPAIPLSAFQGVVRDFDLQLTEPDLTLVDLVSRGLELPITSVKQLMAWGVCMPGLSVDFPDITIKALLNQGIQISQETLSRLKDLGLSTSEVTLKGLSDMHLQLPKVQLKQLPSLMCAFPAVTLESLQNAGFNLPSELNVDTFAVDFASITLPMLVANDVPLMNVNLGELVSAGLGLPGLRLPPRALNVGLKLNIFGRFHLQVAQHLVHMKVMLSYFQIMSIMALNYDVPWTPGFRNLFSWMSLFNFEFAPLIGLGCMGSTFYTTLMLTTLLPMAVLFLMFAFYRISKLQVTRFYNSKEPYTKATDLELHRWLSQLKVKCTKYALTLLLLVYPSVSRTVLLTFKVRGPIEGVNYIEADMRLPAEGGAYNAAAVWAVLMVMLYPIGILVLCFYFVWKYREQLHDPKVQERFGMLYAGVSCTDATARISQLTFLSSLYCVFMSAV